MTSRRKNLSPTARTILEMISKGNTYEQVLSVHPAFTYMDIFASAREAIETIDEHAMAIDVRLARIRATYPRAYERWISSEEEQLIQILRAGHLTNQIPDKLQRQPSAIRSRLKRMGEVE